MEKGHFAGTWRSFLISGASIRSCWTRQSRPQRTPVSFYQTTSRETIYSEIEIRSFQLFLLHTFDECRFSLERRVEICKRFRANLAPTFPPRKIPIHRIFDSTNFMSYREHTDAFAKYTHANPANCETARVIRSVSNTFLSDGIVISILFLLLPTYLPPLLHLLEWILLFEEDIARQTVTCDFFM